MSSFDERVKHNTDIENGNKLFLQTLENIWDDSFNNKRLAVGYQPRTKTRYQIRREKALDDYLDKKLTRQQYYFEYYMAILEKEFN
jgi:hypothetical protein